MTINGKATVAKKHSKVQKEHGHINHMGGVSYSINDPILQLRVVASSSFFGEPMYYHDETEKSKKEHTFDEYSGKMPKLHSSEYKYLDTTLGNILNIPDYHDYTASKLMEKVIDTAIEFNPEMALQEAVRLRNEDHIRVTPQVIMVRVSNSDKVRGTGLIAKYASQIMKRPDDAVTQLAYQLKVFGKPIPNALKKAWKKFIESRDEYQLAKYQMSNKEFKMVDLVNMSHAHNPAIDKLMKGTLTLTGQTWEALTSQKGSNTETWSEAVPLMGHMALLRNLRNLCENKVPTDLYVNKLINGAKTGQQLPFRYYSAYNALKGSNSKVSGTVFDAVEQCLENSLGNLPTFKGRVMSLCDNSGSAHGTMTSKMGSVKISDIANLTAVITGKCSEEGYVGVFGDRLKVMPIRKKASVMDQLKEVDNLGNSIGGSTENGIWLFFDNAIKNKEHWDHIFVYSDMQAGHGGLYGNGGYNDYVWPGKGYQRYIDVAKLIKDYRSKVNPNVNVYLVQMAGYQDTLAPEFYDKTFILGGWGEGLLKFAHKMSELGLENK